MEAEGEVAEPGAPLALLDGVPLQAPPRRSSLSGPTLHCPRVRSLSAALYHR